MQAFGKLPFSNQFFFLSFIKTMKKRKDESPFLWCMDLVTPARILKFLTLMKHDFDNYARAVSSHFLTWISFRSQSRSHDTLKLPKKVKSERFLKEYLKKKKKKSVVQLPAKMHFFQTKQISSHFTRHLSFFLLLTFSLLLLLLFLSLLLLLLKSGFDSEILYW